MKNEIKIKTIGQLLDYVETEQKAKELIDYITNLQEENERLKLNHKQLKDIEKTALSNSKLIKENERLIISLEAQEELTINEHTKVEDYKSRCEKALDKLYCYGEVFDSKILQQFQKEMMDILGDNNG